MMRIYENEFNKRVYNVAFKGKMQFGGHQRSRVTVNEYWRDNRLGFNHIKRKFYNNERWKLFCHGHTEVSEGR